MTRTLFASLLLGLSLHLTPPLHAQGTREGIAVHGHWVMEVTNPDGTLAARREFDNALLFGGMNVLSAVLGRSISFGPIGLFLGARTFGYPEAEPTSQADPTSPFEGLNFSVAVTSGVAAGTGNVDQTQVVLTGTATAQYDGTIKSVWTTIQYCGGGTAPSQCTSGPKRLFSGTTVKGKTGLPEPLVLVKDQDVKVTVTISFR